MKPFLSLLFLLLTVQFSWSQKQDRHFFSFNNTKLDKALGEIERQFDVKYSYADSLVVSRAVDLTPGRYSLKELHSAIIQQTSLTIVKIDNRYYSVCQKPEDIPAEQLQEILVEGYLSKGIEKTSQKVIISPQKVEELPGVTDADILLSLQQLPGVKSPNETASGLHIRGGTPDQNLILWDGIRMYHPGHLFGMISGFNPNVVQTVNYYNKATNPKFGERISGVIDIRSADKIPDTLKVDAGTNALNADVYLRAPLTKKLSLQLAGRKSFTEWLQTPTFTALAEKVFQNTNFSDYNEDNGFGFQDYFAKLNFDPDAKNGLSFSAIAIDNHLDFNSAETSESKNQKMDIMNSGYSLKWNHEYRSGLTQDILLYYSAYTFDYVKNEAHAEDTFDRFTKKNRVTDSGGEINFNDDLTDNLSFDFGYQLSGNDISHAFISRSQDLEIILDQKHGKNSTHSGYSYFKYAMDSWDFQAGARFNYFAKLKAKSFEPRAFIQKRLTPTFVWQASYERKSQILSQIRESVTNDLSLENYVWMLSDAADYPIQKANQFTSGIVFKTKSFLVDIDAYYKTIDGITSLSFGFLHQYDSSIRQGNGYTKGLDLLIQKSAQNWRAWITYTYQDSQNRYDGLNGGDYFPITSDIKHAVTVSFYKKWGNYSIAAGWFWHTGKPYSLLNDDNDIVAFNNQRLPAYHRLDLSATYEFHRRKSWSGKAGFSMLNVYDRHSVISKEYERQYTAIGEIIDSDYAVRDYYSLGFTPNVFLRMSF